VAAADYDAIELRVYGGADGFFELYDDDGVSAAVGPRVIGCSPNVRHVMGWLAKVNTGSLYPYTRPFRALLNPKPKALDCTTTGSARR
jgi:hypothetical protein